MRLPSATVCVRKEAFLRRLENVVLPPHIASNTQEANRRMAEAVVANLQHFLLVGGTHFLACRAAPSDAQIPMGASDTQERQRNQAASNV